MKGLALIGALAVAYGAEVMTSGFAFGDMIRADALNWPLAFTGSFLFGGGLIAMSETDKQRQFWGRVGLAWALTVSSLAATNRTIFDPLQGRIGVFSESAASLRDEPDLLKAKFNDLDAKLAKKGQAAARERERYAQARRSRPEAMKETGSAEAAAERVRDAARDVPAGTIRMHNIPLGSRAAFLECS